MKCALVTGGSRGIGRAICIKLSQLGYYVLVNYKGNIEAAGQTLAAIQQGGGRGEIIAFDVANAEQTQEVLGQWVETHTADEIEVLVNNAGIREDSLMMWMKPEQWKSVMSTNLDGFYNVTRLVLNQMLLKRYGRIINIVSLSGQKGLAGQTNYSAAKAGVIGATKALAQEVGRRGVTVNAVSPGFIKTDMTEGLDEKQLEALIPVKRFGTPEEVAHVVAFLAAKESSYITGEVIAVNGGLYS